MHFQVHSIRLIAICQLAFPKSKWLQREWKTARAREHTQDGSRSVFHNLVSQATCCYFCCILLFIETKRSRLHKGMNTGIQRSLGDTLEDGYQKRKIMTISREAKQKQKHKTFLAIFNPFIKAWRKLGLKGNFLNLIKKCFLKTYN